MAYIGYALDILFSAIFLSALRSKASNLTNFRYEIISYRIIYNPVYVNFAAWFVLTCEMLLVVCFVTGLAPEFGIGLAIFLLVIFSVLYWRKRKFTGVSGCHCFGHDSWLNRIPLYRNGTLIFLLAARLFVPFRQQVNGNTLLVLVVSLIMSYVLSGNIKSARLYRRVRSSVSEIAETIRKITGKYYTFLFVLGNQTDITSGLDKLLSNISKNTNPCDVAVILDAPDWYIEMKRRKWNNTLVLPAANFLPHRTAFPFVLVYKRKKATRVVYSMVTEIDGFVEWWGNRFEKTSAMAQSHSYNM